MMIIFVLLTMAIIHFLPKSLKWCQLPYRNCNCFCIDYPFKCPDKNGWGHCIHIGRIAKIPFTESSVHLRNIKNCIPYSLIMALVGLIESLLTLTVIDEMTETRGRGNKESIAQGIANVTCGFFGGMGGCAMIGQSIINVSSGGRQRLSTIVAPITLLMFILFGSSYIEKVPMAALVGLMFMVSVGTFEWASLKMFRKMPITDVIVMIVVAGVTVVFHNLAVAVFIGIIISSLAFAWEHATNIHARPQIDEDGNKIYKVDGPLFFGSVAAFQERFNVADDPETIIVDFRKSKVLDHSAIESLNKLTERYAKVGKEVHLRHLSQDCRTLLDNASAIIEVNIWEDPKYKMVSNRLA